MLKKFISVSVLIFILTLTVSAADFPPSSNKEFKVYKSGGDSLAVSQLLGINNDDFLKLCKDNNIIYFAVNSDKSEQIRLTSEETDFSKKVANLSKLSENKIKELFTELTGNSEIKGKIISKNGQKYVKTKALSTDSGGKYTVTQYITVAEKKDIVLSVFSDETESDYAEKVFKSFNYSDFTGTGSESHSFYQYFILILIALLIPTASYIIFTIVRDVKNTVLEKK